MCTSRRKPNRRERRKIRQDESRCGASLYNGKSGLNIMITPGISVSGKLVLLEPKDDAAPQAPPVGLKQGDSTMNRDNPNAWLAFAGWLFVLFIILADHHFSVLRLPCFPPLLFWRWLCSVPPPFHLQVSMWRGGVWIITPMPSLRSLLSPNENRR